MKVWIDAHISPGIAAWITENFAVEAKSLRGLGLREASDLEIFQRAKSEDVVFITKDADFLDLVQLRGAPPCVILLRCGNTTNHRLREIFANYLQGALDRFKEGETIVEIE